ncbi:hypothetical protein MA5S0422_1373 [Mycobacteroides abscessus 5S-0422]|uniref:Uncharacterized protein n=1 Tax=Mycobacteroides abscessus subsp. bolletii 1513 TaxID=1299321 RepID=X8DWY2_9MYCO|nr:hypothetical protein MA5S0304_0384 [Mycobacteroides abscessus 5S-0304]EIU16728.1 hypothetical protein MA5S0421_0642 [Mycobacteroides abscessus 5S-0421]EIU18449.1 hypothetical protein MA5S0422_1373 [Mycobacteroides abscessus 5S-0422]EIU27945.1 hypothetical protein MA5S0708_0866 [Mycobacteroides abscessus 5S-0708]EIU33550.1 hypothetical protein MA5S0817_0418 [Mycobacteroides abscessus 5S-0817]EIU35063.1 hypothetical protein MA5S1212_0809 [Mycobacteroides abscessus 5S-1212]EIU42518.1 hypothet
MSGHLTSACAPHHLVSHGWTTRKHPNGITEWIPTHNPISKI